MAHYPTGNGNGDSKMPAKKRAKAKVEILRPVAVWVDATLFAARGFALAKKARMFSGGGCQRMTLVPPGYTITPTPAKSRGGGKVERLKYYSSPDGSMYWTVGKGLATRFSETEPNGVKCAAIKSDFPGFAPRITPARAAAIKASWKKGRAK